MVAKVAIVGLACRYPDANSPSELWDNVLAQRRAFRRIPTQRLRIEDYDPRNTQLADSTYVKSAAVLEGYAFDRARFRVGTANYRSADMTHWLALNVAADALDDAGFTANHPQHKQVTGVLLGNSLTGEFSRASLLRLRWPYVQRTLLGVLNARGWDRAEQADLVAQLEIAFKAPFPVPDEETLAGGLSNTIAGRICNHFGFNGGGYSVDGACASSLLAVARACSALAAGELDIALAGGVDLSLDPFELVGFARTGALAKQDMRIYDAQPTGFLPGEGCGFAVLMRLEDALAEGRRVRAVIRGWGVSSDGKGGLTRPEADGQRLALDRAYAYADLSIDRVALFEGHGTGTAVGDATELATLTRARRDLNPRARAAAIGSIKANIGHTKAASGIAGLIKTCMALDAAVLPPTTGCDRPHQLLTDPDPALRVLARAEPWPDDRELVAGVSSMGFGGINVHLVVTDAQSIPRRNLSARERRLDATAQDCELFVLCATDVTSAASRAREISAIATYLAQSDLADLAADLARELSTRPVRVAVVAKNPEQLAERLARAAGLLDAMLTPAITFDDGVFIGVGRREPRIGLLFPGQGSPAHSRGGIWRRRFAEVDDIYLHAELPEGDEIDTAVAQPALVTASLAALRVLERVGLRASIAIGHSLGELSALTWAGAFDENTALRIAHARGRAMSTYGDAHGAMASVSLSPTEAARWLENCEVEIAAFNAPQQVVVSGASIDIASLVSRLHAQGVQATRLSVSHAFHSRLIKAAEPALRAALVSERVLAPTRSMVSTVTGTLLPHDIDVRALLCQQIVAPVKFIQALSDEACNDVDLWIEAGGGSVLSRLARTSIATPTLPVDACGDSFSGLLSALGAAYALGASLDLTELFVDRAIRPFSYLPGNFLVNPCEAAPRSSGAVELPIADATAPAAQPHKRVTASANLESGETSVLDELIQRLAVKTELPITTITPGSRLLSDLHLNSISVGQLVVETAQALGLLAPVSPTDFADASVGEIAQALTRMRDGVTTQEAFPSGLEHWLRSFRVDWKPTTIAARRGMPSAASWLVVSEPGHQLAEPLRQQLEASGVGPGIALMLNATNSDEPPFELLLAAARQLQQQRDAIFLLVQGAPGAAGFARTLHLERSEGTTVVVEVPLDHPDALSWAVAEAAVANGFVEARYSREGVREEPRWEVIDIDTDVSDDAIALPRADEVLLVTGGGRGIAAECALAIAVETGCKLALLGRSDRKVHPELARNLERFASAGVTARYYVADVADADAVNATICSVRSELGPVVAILHGAGINSPRLASQLDEAMMRRTFEPKVPGLRHVLSAIHPKELRLLVTFGSIIARTGLAGEADYALANEWLALEVEAFANQHPGCRCRNIEWSVWSGTGMGERLDRVEALLRQGITPIPPDAGSKCLLAVCRRGELPISTVVCGRFGNPPTVRLASSQLPFLRFLEHVRFHVPHVELIVDAELSHDTDPFLADHVYRDEPLFPAVLGLEAMLQVAIALDKRAEAAQSRLESVCFESVRFERPIVVAKNLSIVIRLVALRRASGIVDVALRCSSTAFQVDHFRATCVLDYNAQAPALLDTTEPDTHEAEVALTPSSDLYGPLLPHRGIFQRVREYRRLSAETCIAIVASDPVLPWFSRALPGELLLGDPGARDAAIHALQACIPHKTILPVGIARLEVKSLATSPSWRVVANERSRNANTLVYDLEIFNEDGGCRELWSGLALRIVRECPLPLHWPLALLGPYLQRRVGELLPGTQLSIALDHGKRSETHEDARRVIATALGEPIEIHRRSDGKPMASRGYNVSFAYSAGLVTAVASRHAVSCDLESIGQRPPSTWRDLLGPKRWALAQQLADERAEDLNIAATRVWTSIESFKKIGLPIDAPITLGKHSDDSWTLLHSGKFSTATCLIHARGVDPPMALSITSASALELGD